MLAKELFPGNYTPTPTHCFMTLLHQKGLLRRCAAAAAAGARVLVLVGAAAAA
jgi:NAD-dependent deacetylase sirtuin 2